MKIIPHMELKLSMCGRSFESTLFFACRDSPRVVLCCLYPGSGSCFSLLICMLNNILHRGREVLLLSQYVGAFYVCVLA
jgi:hypothetical protein